MYLITIVNSNRPAKFHALDLTEVTELIEKFHPECTVIEQLPALADLSNGKEVENE